jgi:signal transduction histidine kinase
VFIGSFFILEFIGLYFSTQHILNGLGGLHNSIRAITQVRQLRQLVLTHQGVLKKASNSPMSKEEILIFKSTDEQMNEFFTSSLELTKNNPTVYKLIYDAQKTLKPLNEQVVQLIQGNKGTKINPLIVDQYMLEAQEQLGKVQLVLADEADQIFSQIYNSRFIPLIVGLILSGFFLLVALLMGINLKNKINRPIQKLINTARKFADGNLSVRAQISEANEVGALTNTFNVMAAKLEESINERKHAAEDLLIAKEAAEEANLAKSAFLANMSHEIRTPLGAVMGFADLVVDQQMPEAEKARFVGAIKRNGELLSNIINDILDLSKIEAGKMEILKHEVALAEVLTDTKTLLDLQAKEKGIHLRVQVSPNTPEKIKTDPLRLRQILMNVIGNAIKFTSKGGVDVQVQYENSSGQDLLQFFVKDTGCGIDENQKEKLFAPFSQADSTLKRKFGGTGLGLILSKRFANLLGGDVAIVQSTLDVGSTFVISINAGPTSAKATSLELKTKSSATNPEKSSKPLDGIQVLLAEDSPDNQILVSHLLTIAGARVEMASNGQEASEKAMLNAYDVILMDLQMPIMDGYEATALLRKQGYTGKILALTAHALNEDRDRSLRSGFDDHISKPINRETLINSIYTASTK